MQDSRFEETILHNDISNFIEDDLTQTYEPVICDLDTVSIYENTKDSFHIENEVEKSIINIHAIDSPTACLEENHREFQAERLIEIPFVGSSFPVDITEKNSKTAILDIKPCVKKNGSKIPIGIISIVLLLCVMFIKRVHDNDILDRFKLDCIIVKSVFDSRIFSYSLIHMNFEHLIPNLIFLTLFGSIVEIKLGTLNFLISYFSICYLVGLGWHFRKVNPIGRCAANQSSVIGSSGAVYGIMTIAFLDCLFTPLFKSEYRFWNIFGSLATLFAISVLYLNEIVFNPNEKTATDVHIIGSIVGLCFFILLLAKDSIFNYFQRK